MSPSWRSSYIIAGECLSVSCWRWNHDLRSGVTLMWSWERGKVCLRIKTIQTEQGERSRFWESLISPASSCPWVWIILDESLWLPISWIIKFPLCWDRLELSFLPLKEFKRNSTIPLLPRRNTLYPTPHPPDISFTTSEGRVFPVSFGFAPSTGIFPSANSPTGKLNETLTLAPLPAFCRFELIGNVP